MNRIKTFKQFHNTYSMNEGIGKIWRNLTGKNAKRIEEVLGMLNQSSQLDKMESSISKLPSRVNRDEAKTQYIKDWRKGIEGGQIDFLPDSIKNTILNLLTIGPKELPESLEEIRDMDDSEWRRAKRHIAYVMDSLTDPDTITSRISRNSTDIQGRNLVSKVIEFNSEIKELANKISSGSFPSILYWGDGLSHLNNYDISELVKSFCLKLSNKMYHRDNYSSYNIGSEMTHDYTDEYGLGYKSKFKDTMDLKVSETPGFISLQKEIESIRPTVESLIDKKNELEKEREEVSGIVSTSDIPRTEDPTVIKLKDVTKNGNREVTHLYISNIIKRFDSIKGIVGDLKVSEVIGSSKFGQSDRGFGEVETVTLEDSDEKVATRSEDGGLVCGNKLYFGNIHADINMDNIDMYLKRIGGRYEPRVSGKAIYCATYVSAAAQYAQHRTETVNNQIKTAMFTKGSAWSPTIYKLTIKPGTKFQHKSDTDMDSDEAKNLLKIGLAGIHSGNDRVGGGDTQESAIVDSSCILSVEKLSLSDIEAIDEREWSRGSDVGKQEAIDFFKKFPAYR